MADGNYNRKLNAILIAGVAGYSRLMGDDNIATVSTLKSHRNLIAEKVLLFNGRVVDSKENILVALLCHNQIYILVKENNDSHNMKGGHQC
jgi:adenylate cyclase